MEPSTPRLTPRQAECLRLVGEGLTSKEIALALGIAKNTVDSYVAEAVDALGARDRRDAARRWRRLDPPPIGSGDDRARVDPPAPVVEVDPASIEGAAETAGPDGSARFGLPFATRAQPRNTLGTTARLLWILAIAFGALSAVSLTISIASGSNSLAWTAGAAAHDGN